MHLISCSLALRVGMSNSRSSDGHRDTRSDTLTPGSSSLRASSLLVRPWGVEGCQSAQVIMQLLIRREGLRKLCWSQRGEEANRNANNLIRSNPVQYRMRASPAPHLLAGPAAGASGCRRASAPACPQSQAPGRPAPSASAQLPPGSAGRGKHIVDMYTAEDGSAAGILRALVIIPLEEAHPAQLLDEHQLD